MSEAEARQIERDSLFLLAQLTLEGSAQEFRVKVRNLSAGGMMAEGDVPVLRGAFVSVDLRGIGQVRGSVAWVQDSRFGVAFMEEIDPKLARYSPAKSAGAEHFVSDLHRTIGTGGGDEARLRKV